MCHFYIMWWLTQKRMIPSRGSPVSTVICCRPFTAEVEGALCSPHIHQLWLGCQEHIELCLMGSQDICAEWTVARCCADEWTRFIKPSLWVCSPSLFQVVYFIKPSCSLHIARVNPLWYLICCKKAERTQCEMTDTESTAWCCGSFSKNVYAHDCADKGIMFRSLNASQYEGRRFLAESLPPNAAACCAYRTGLELTSTMEEFSGTVKMC